MPKLVTWMNNQRVGLRQRQGLESIVSFESVPEANIQNTQQAQ